MPSLVPAARCCCCTSPDAASAGAGGVGTRDQHCGGGATNERTRGRRTREAELLSKWGQLQQQQQQQQQLSRSGRCCVSFPPQRRVGERAGVPGGVSAHTCLPTSAPLRREELVPLPVFDLISLSTPRGLTLGADGGDPEYQSSAIPSPLSSPPQGPMPPPPLPFSPIHHPLSLSLSSLSPSLSSRRLSPPSPSPLIYNPVLVSTLSPRLSLCLFDPTAIDVLPAA